MVRTRNHGVESPLPGAAISAFQRYETRLPSSPWALPVPWQSSADFSLETLEVNSGKEGPVTRRFPGKVAGFHSPAIRKKFWKVKGSPAEETCSLWSPCSSMVDGAGGSVNLTRSPAKEESIHNGAGLAAVKSRVFMKPRRLKGHMRLSIAPARRPVRNSFPRRPPILSIRF